MEEHIYDCAESGLLIYGAGTFAPEVAWLANRCSSDSRRVQVRAFIDDGLGECGRQVVGIAVISIKEARARYSADEVVIGVGDPHVRQMLSRKAVDAGFPFSTLIHPTVEKSDSVEIGHGSLIFAGCILTTNVRVGRHVIINMNSTVGHDVVLGDYTTIAPGVHISGCVEVGSRVFLGTGAVIVNGTRDCPLRIGDGAVVGAGACVTKSVAAGAKVFGIPARVHART